MCPMAQSPAGPKKKQHDPARILRALMGAHGVTGVALAAYLDTPPSSLTKRLNGRVPFRVDELLAAAEFLGVDPEVFFQDPSDFTVRLSTSTYVFSQRLSGLYTLVRGYTFPLLARLQFRDNRLAVTPTA